MLGFYKLLLNFNYFKSSFYFSSNNPFFLKQTKIQYQNKQNKNMKHHLLLKNNLLYILL